VLVSFLPMAGAEASGSKAPLFLTTDYSNLIYVYDAGVGQYLDSFDGHFTANDAIAAGDLFGNGFNYVFIAGDEEHHVEIFEPLAGAMILSWDMAYTSGDGFAVGDLDGDGRVEVFIAGDEGHMVDIFDPRTGTLLGSFDAAYTPGDGFAVGDLDGDGMVEVFVAGDEGHVVDIFNPRTGGPPIGSFNCGYGPDDGFAVGDIDGDHKVEILVGGDETHMIDVFNPRTGQPLPSFNGNFTIDDAMAVGDVNGDGKGELVIFGDETNSVEVFDPNTGAMLRSFSGGSDFVDIGIAIGQSFGDRDSDGLPDSWETFGIDTDGDGTPELTLPGANPDRRDIYIEIDYMDCAISGGDCATGDAHSHVPKQAAIDAAVEMFAEAPVYNPDGSFGISLHVEVDDPIPHQNALRLTCFDPETGAGDFYAVKNNPAYFGADNPRQFAYHYSIFAHRQRSDEGSSGCASGGGNFLVTLGGWNVGEGDLDADGLPDADVGTLMQQAGTLVHELGHNLGLGHGGTDGFNYKPNYLSVMNYFFQVSGILPSEKLDYSRLALPGLNETDLDETLGIGYVTENTAYYCPDGTRRTARGLGAIDWDCDDDATETSVSENINDDYVDTNENDERDPGEPDIIGALPGASDWDHLSLGFGTVGFASGGSPDAGPSHGELDYTTYLRIRNLPPVVNAGEDQIVECTGPEGATITLDGSQTYDPNGDELTYTWTGPLGEMTGPVISGVLPLGNHEFTLTVEDGNGSAGTRSDTVVVAVADTVPPEIELAVSPTSLWPPDHRMVDITAQVSASDVCDPNPTLVLFSATSNEPDNGLGDGDTNRDIQGAALGTDDRELALRAERGGGGIGREYTLRYQAEDASGNTSTADASVGVPHD